MVPVKLPKEVLRLFPTWEYRCPCCSAYVESNKSFCPNCKTPFDEKRWRVPPRYLKSHDAVSEYAHKVLAPKLTPEQRELLFRYFTDFFSDGFESGDFSAWSGTAGSPGVVSAQSHHGTYSMYVTGAGADYVHRYFTGQTTVFMRFYLRLNSVMANYASWEIAQFNKGASSICRLRIYHASGTEYYLRIWRWYPSSAQAGSAAITIDANAWHCLEMKFVRDASSGEYRAYYDGEEKISETGLNTSGVADCDRIICGNVSTGSVDYYIDCVLVADTYIGPESVGQTYTKAWTTDVLFKKLGIPKSLGVDAAFQKQDIQKNFGLDAAFQKRFIIQKQVDAIFKRFGIVKSFAVDARFGALLTQTVSRQIDVLLKKLDATKSFGVDAYFGAVGAETYAKNFALDVVFAYKVRLPELWLDENGKIVLNISKPYAWVGS